MTSFGLIFGIYPFSVAGTPTGLATGPEDDYEKIGVALKELQSKATTLLPRTYIVYSGPELLNKVLSYVKRYVKVGEKWGFKWDMVLGFYDSGRELGWMA
ncbi:hypothetical protein B6A27_03415 [Anoxybacillus sp. UARK-01]|uniref:hypothetical protein n=1 Tax=Anoxybacillus sp. UARK-01 TaxID=1895648 RepID=UPI0009BA2AE9|nr:hypothetical protein [Anoxybacillus sp. UARK-01]OQM46844.1 hypothetical protein B6A27_03415 [Anoxybacillus sp. UARK-01]